MKINRDEKEWRELRNNIKAGPLAPGSVVQSMGPKHCASYDRTFAEHRLSFRLSAGALDRAGMSDE